ncbi:MAG: hypothetical protein AAF587_31300 [Bacteroidota bacterium]
MATFIHRFRPLILAAFLLTSMLSFTSCQQLENVEESLLDEGTILKPDYRLCACCGGWFIEIGDETYRMTVLPPESALDLSSGQYPVEVLLRWRKPLAPCLGDEINVSEIRSKN